jgi:hypothetical protein
VKRILFALLLGASALSVPAANSPAPVELLYHLSPDNAFSFQTTLKLDGQVKLPDETQPEIVKAEMQMRQRVKVLPSEEKAKLALENRLYHLTLTQNGTTSQASGIPPITTIMDAHGKLLEMKGLEVLSNAYLPGLDATTFSSLLYNLPAFPEKPVKTGESWTDTVPVQLPNGQRTTAERKLTLLSVGAEKDGSPSARLRSEVKLPIDVKVEGANGGTLKGAQTGSGESRILLADGMPLETRTDMKLEVVADPNGSQPQRKKDATVRVTTQIHVEAKRIPDTPPTEDKSSQVPPPLPDAPP